MWVDSGHGIPLEKPEAVVQAIRGAVQAARAPRAAAPAVCNCGKRVAGCVYAGCAIWWVGVCYKLNS